MIFSSPKSHKNRFDILEDIRDMLGFSEMEWKGLFHLVRKSSAGYACFTFRFGDYVLDLETARALSLWLCWLLLFHDKRVACSHFIHP